MESETNKKKIKYHNIFLYAISFFLIYFVSFGIPGILLITFINFFLIPKVLNASNFLDLFTNLNSLIILIFTPIIIIVCYLLHLFIIAINLKIVFYYTEKKEPTRDGIIPRDFPNKALKFYHVRSFILKYPKWAFSKSPFPWLTIKLFNFIGANQMGKGTTLEEQVVGDKLIKTGKNCYFGVNSALASHLVEGISGNVNFFTIKIGNNVTFSAFGMAGPGTEIGDNVAMLPISAAPKHNQLRSNNYYFGLPVRKIFKKKIKECTGLTEDQIIIKKKSRDA